MVPEFDGAVNPLNGNPIPTLNTPPVVPSGAVVFYPDQEEPEAISTVTAGTGSLAGDD
jgi:hypothetical protein